MMHNVDFEIHLLPLHRWISHIVVPHGAIPGNFFEIEVENRPMRRLFAIRQEQYRHKIAKLHKQIIELNDLSEEWAKKREFNSYRLGKLELRYRTFAGEIDRISLHDEVHMNL